MIAYTMVGTNDLSVSRKFYDPIFELLGLDLCWNDTQSVSYGKLSDPYYPRYFVGYPFDNAKARNGNGTMTAFLCKDEDTVNQIYAVGIENGASCEGKPGFRPEYGERFYAAYIRDPDLNKLAFVVY